MHEIKIIFCFHEKKQSQKKNNDDFQNVVICDWIPNTLRDLQTSDVKDLIINLATLAYGNRANATKFAQANNSDLLRALKHLMETRLYSTLTILSALSTLCNFSSAHASKAFHINWFSASPNLCYLI